MLGHLLQSVCFIGAKMDASGQRIWTDPKGWDMETANGPHDRIVGS